MSQQLPLDLAWRSSQDAGDYIVSTANAEAVAWIDTWPAWPAAAMVLLGPKAAGKTHLAHVWQEKAQAEFYEQPLDLQALHQNAVLDKCDTWAATAQTELFHLLNRAKEERFSLLLCATMPPKDWDVTLPDLSSRLQALPVATLHEPDDTLLAALFTKAMSERGMIVKPELADYLFPRLPRSAAAIVPFATDLDRFALGEGRGLTLATVRAFLASRAVEPSA